MTIRIVEGDCRDLLREMDAESVHCCITSPPYFGLRDYGVSGQIGLEQTPEEFVAQLVDVFREVKRVMRPDGTLWLNLGDSYAAGGNGGHQRSRPQGDTGQMADRAVGKARDINRKTPSFHGHKDRGMGDLTGHAKKAPPGFKAKDLLGMPWMVAFALRADGWYLRQEIIWAKPNPMPESVTDRCTKSHEHIFLLTKGPQYYFDADAIAEPVTSPPNWKTPDGWDTSSGAGGRGNFHREGREKGATGYEPKPKKSGNIERKPSSARGAPAGTGKNQAGSVPWEGTTRNKRSVWTVATQPFSEAHFATFPADLIKPCVMAGCPEGGTVLDPFGGAGTTGLVADRLGRNAILIELNPQYADMARRRITKDAPLFAEVT